MCAVSIVQGQPQNVRAASSSPLTFGKDSQCNASEGGKWWRRIVLSRRIIHPLKVPSPRGWFGERKQSRTCQRTPSAKGIQSLPEGESKNPAVPFPHNLTCKRSNVPFSPCAKKSVAQLLNKTGKNTHLRQQASKEYRIYPRESSFHPDWHGQLPTGVDFLLRTALFGTQICLLSLLSMALVKILCRFLEKAGRDNQPFLRLCSSKDSSFLLGSVLSSGSGSHLLWNSTSLQGILSSLIYITTYLTGR